MKILLITAIFSCFSINMYAQPKTNDSILTKIKDVGYHESQVKMLTYELSDVYGQRPDLQMFTLKIIVPIVAVGM